MILYHIKKGSNELIIFHKKNLVYIFLHIRKKLIPDRLHCRSIGDGVGALKLHHFSRGDRRGHASRLRRFHTDNFDLWIQHFSEG